MAERYLKAPYLCVGPGHQDRDGDPYRQPVRGRRRPPGERRRRLRSGSGGACVVVDFGTGSTSTPSRRTGSTSAVRSRPAWRSRSRRSPSVARGSRASSSREPEAAIGKSTKGAIQSGVIYGFAGMIDGIARRIEAELGGDIEFIATGGLASAIVPFCETIDDRRRPAHAHGAAPDLGAESVSRQPALTEPFRIGDVEIANRVLLAPLAGIGNWFVRLQARRHGAGLAVSEMVSSFAIRHGNERTLREMLTVHPDEHPVSIQLFGPDPDVMAGARARRRRRGRRHRRHQHGLPGPEDLQVGRRGRASSRAGARARGRPGRDRGLGPAGHREAALRPRARRPLGLRPRAAARERRPASRRIGFHPRSAAVHHSGQPDYALARELVGAVDVPVIISGGLRSAEAARRGLLGVRCRRGDDRPWRPRLAVDLRGADRSPRPSRPAARRS